MARLASELQSKILTEDQLPQVFPLVERHHKFLSLTEWLHFAECYRGGPENGGRGFLALEDHSAVIKALAQFAIDYELMEGQVLRAGNLLALSVLPRDGRLIAERMVTALEELAKQHDCKALYLSQPFGAGVRWRPLEDLDPSAFGLHLSHCTTRKAL